LHDKQQFDEVLRSLAGEQPDVVIFSHDSSEWLPSAYPYTPPGVFAARDPVADYILAHYHPCSVLRTSWKYHALYMVRKNLSCPHDGAHDRRAKTDSDMPQPEPATTNRMSSQ